MRIGKTRLDVCCFPLVLALCAAGCDPELPVCEPAEAQAPLFYDENGFPAYPGQALVEVSCGAGTFCHAQAIPTEDRLGAPQGLDLDVGVALDPAGLERLAYARRVSWNLRHSIAREVELGTMPPPGAAGATALAAAPRYVGTDADGRRVELPAIDSPEGEAMLRNWLACGAQVIEGTEGVSTGVGDIAARASVCPASQASCEDVCIDVTADDANCGGCGLACGAEQRCVDAACTCLNELAACGTACVELASDGAHCGACDNSCGARFCANSTCVDSCPGDTTDCGGSCVDLQSSLANCGGCGAPCGAGESCTMGTCSCAGGFEICAGGCVDTQTDALHCGGCDAPCPGGASCAGGTCACGGGTTECGGACVDTATSTTHCGGCDRPCDPGDGCSAGTCVGCGPAVSFASDVQPILTAGCLGMGCHEGARPAASLSLEAGRAYDELLNAPASCGAIPLVTAGDIGASYLWSKLIDVGVCSGTQMPKRGQTLPAGDLAIIESWICRGALND